jgi:hypothetical protein
MSDPTPPPVPVDEGDERKRDRTIRKLYAWRAEFLDVEDTGRNLTPTQEAALDTLNEAIDSLETAERRIKAVRSERDAELPGWKDAPDRPGYWLLDRCDGERDWFSVVRNTDGTLCLGRIGTPLPSDRWFGPVIITPDGGRKT